MTSAVRGVPNSGAWAYLAHGLLAPSLLPADLRMESASPLVLVREKEEDLEDLADGLKALDIIAGTLKGAEPPFFGEDPQLRLASVERLHLGARLALATVESLGLPSPDPLRYAELRAVLRPGKETGRKELLSKLSSSGYRRVDFVEGPGEFAARGAVVDFFPMEPTRAVRVLYDADEIASLRTFDPQTQAGSPELLEEAVLAPAAEEPSGRTLADALAERGLWLVEEGARLPVEPSRKIVIGQTGPVDFGAVAQSAAGLGVRAAAEQCREWIGDGMRILVFSMNRGEDERLQEMFEGLVPEGVQFLVGPLRQGFASRRLGLAVLTSSEIFGRRYRTGRMLRPMLQGRARVRWGELKKGDYVVHEHYGIGRYLGLEAVGTTDCLRLEYRSGDTLFVPMGDFRCIQRYVGSEGHRPRLSSLDRRTWQDVVERVREGVRELAAELLKLEAARRALPGHAFPADSRMESEFAESFPFEETPDQRKAIGEVKEDLMTPCPMDRVVIGDVGFGKTEVAMRAALKCVAGLRQAALLVPTTVLADQHARNFRRRFAEYPVRIEMLSRFQTKAEQRRVLGGLAAGSVDIVVGTHRLLQEDVRFKDLGLLVVDEEHRFGVRDKERLKALRKTLDCLSLSATPIPRTLHQCLSGLRRVSLISSAPVGRQPIVTQVLPFTEKHAASAIAAELERGGQVFYVHNRVRSLPETLERLSRLLPGVRFVMGHGQMRSDQLEKAMWDFFNRKYDVLVASSIIESGLDIPSVNTLLIENAQDFGLSQLYQLRGRIGRERQKAYCYLYYPSDAGELRDLNEEARKRLEALREFGTLGSGFSLAMRDLEIRGAGDLLGGKQHGFLNAVGAEFYTELLEGETAKLLGKKAAGGKDEPAHMDLGISAFLPEDYIPGDMERIRLYKRLLAAEPDVLDSIKRELADISGPPPAPVENLFTVLRIRRLASGLRVRSVVQRGPRVEIYFQPDAAVPVDVITRWMGTYKDRIEFVRSAEGDGLRVENAGRDPIAWILDFLDGLARGRK
ncbi:MAG: transcription-repair coupling factor [Elusimicrobiota bacterium]